MSVSQKKTGGRDSEGLKEIRKIKGNDVERALRDAEGREDEDRGWENK